MHQDFSWGSYAETASGKTKSSWTLELKIPLINIGLKGEVSKNWRFNIARNIPKRENQKSVSSVWSYTGGNFHKPWLFGKVIGPNGVSRFSEIWNYNDKKWLCRGMAAVVKSTDCYFKACNKYEGFYPENAEVSGELNDCRNVCVPQYPSKADGYLRIYQKTGFKEYQSMSHQFIGKLVNFMKETRDKDNKPWIPWGHVMYRDGKVYGYSKGPKFGRLSHRHFKWNQSKVTFPVENQDYVDAFGIGFWDLSKIKQSMSSVMEKDVLNVLECILDFYHRDYVLKNQGGVYYWRTDDFKPLKPKMPITSPIWRKLGTDIVYLIMAYDNMNGPGSDKYIESLNKFSLYYMNGRMKRYNNVKDQSTEKQRKALWRLNYLDARMLNAAYHLKNKHKDSALLDWMRANLKKLPRYNKVPKVEFMLDGAMHWGESSIPLMKMFAELNPEILKKFVNEICTYNIFPKGVCTSGHIAEPINESGFPPLLDYGFEAWKKNALETETFIKVVKQVYLILGHPDLLRDTDDWVRDVAEEDRLEPDWRATPMHCFVQNEMGEGFYKGGITQAYTKYWDFYTPGDRKHYKIYFDMRKRGAKNRYYQYTAPFQNHAEPFCYGNAHTFNLADTTGHQDIFKNITLKDNLTVNVSIRIPELPEGTPCYGIFDVTDIVYKDQSQYTPTGFEISKVLHKETSVATDYYAILEYEKPRSDIDKARLVVYLEGMGKETESELKFMIKKKNNDYFRK